MCLPFHYFQHTQTAGSHNDTAMPMPVINKPVKYIPSHNTDTKLSDVGTLNISH